jgi:hypothetical protein
MRYLAVFSNKGWQTINVNANCNVVATGTRDEMVAKAKELNEMVKEESEMPAVAYG